VTTTTAYGAVMVDDAAYYTEGSAGAGGANIINLTGKTGTSADEFERSATRFVSVAVPQGAVINSAVLTLWYGYDFKFSLSAGSVCDIYGKDVDNSGSLSSWSSTSIYSPTTTASVIGQTWYTTTNKGSNDATVTSIVQEIVDRVGWTSGNALTLIFDMLNPAYDDNYNGAEGPFDPVNPGDTDNPTLWPRLTIDYTAGGPPPATFTPKVMVY
jgi:hypothetical protein